MAFGMRRPGDTAPAGPRSAAGAPTAARIAVAYLVLVGAFAVATSVAGLRMRTTVPSRDDWNVLHYMFERSSLAGWLWAGENGHRLPGTLLLVYLDYVWLGGRMLLPVAASVACTWAAAGAIAASFGREARQTTVRLTLGLALFTLFWSAASFDFTWGLQLSNVMAATSTIVALASFGAWVVRRRAGSPGPAVPFLLLTIGAATIATFSHGLGFSVWPALIAVALLVRTARPLALLLVATAVVELAVYVTGLGHGRGGASYGELLLHHVVGIGMMDVAFLGASPTRVMAAFGDWPDTSSYAVSTGIGAIAMALAVAPIRDLARAPAGARARDVLGVGLMAAAVTSGALVAVNRYPFAIAAITIRFSTATALFWVGLLCTLPRPGAQGPGRHAGTVAGLVVLLSALMLPSLQKEWTSERVEADRAYAEGLLHVLGIRWDPMAGMEFGRKPERTYRVVGHLKASHWAMFADRRDELLGSRLHDRFAVLSRRHCRGDLLWRRPIEAGTGPMLRIAGATSEAGASGTPAAVVTDAQDVIRGMALHVTRLEPFLPQSFLPVPHGWLGAVAGYDPGATYTVNLLRADGRSVCRGLAFRDLE